MSGIFAYGLAEVLRGNVNLITDDIRILSIETGYSVNLATHQDLADITSTLRDVHVGVALTGKTLSAAQYDVADVPSIPGGTGGAVIGYVVYKHTGVDATSTLLFWLDPANGLYTPNGVAQGPLALSASFLASWQIASLYRTGVTQMLNGTINYLTADIRLQLVTSGYSFSALHTSMTDVAVGNRRGAGTALTSKTISDACLVDSADVEVLSVTGTAVNAAVLYLHTGVDATSIPIAYFSGGTMVVTPNGENILVNTPNNIFNVA